MNRRDVAIASAAVLGSVALSLGTAALILLGSAWRVFRSAALWSGFVVTAMGLAAMGYGTGGLDVASAEVAFRDLWGFAVLGGTVGLFVEMWRMMRAAHSDEPARGPAHWYRLIRDALDAFASRRAA